jgi:DNA-binding transcriptional LysR family regulator
MLNVQRFYKHPAGKTSILSAMVPCKKCKVTPEYEVSMELDPYKLLIFHHVAKKRRISHSDLPLSPSVISRHIGDLEHSLGIKLFLRTPGGLVLTPQGRVLFEQAELISNQLLEAQQKVKTLVPGYKENLTVIMPTSWASHVVVGYIGRFIKENRHISLNIVSDDRTPDLTSGSSEQQVVAILPYAPKEAAMVKRFIMPFTLKLFAHQDYVQARGLPQSLGDLENHDLIGSSARDRYFVDLDWHLRVGLPTGENRSPLLRVNNIYAALAVGLGIGTLAAENYLLRQSSLVAILPELSGPQLNAYYVYPDFLRHSPAVKRFGDFLLAAVADYLA